jgi:ABC-2 type transport system ATP-binding protein
MEEADRVAQRIAIIDHGKIISSGTSAQLQQQTGTENLEDAFLKLTGNVIRDEDASATDRLRTHRQQRGGGRR